MINVDITKEDSKQYKCAQFCSQFKNLTFLSLHFTPQLELNEKVKSCDKSQKSLQKYFINHILEHCTKLHRINEVIIGGTDINFDVCTHSLT